jgi:hypothetical protein
MENGRSHGVGYGENWEVAVQCRSLLKVQSVFVLALGRALAEAWAWNQHRPYTQLSNGKWTPLLTKIFLPSHAQSCSFSHWCWTELYSTYILLKLWLIKWYLCFADASGTGPGKQKAWATSDCSLVPQHQRLIFIVLLRRYSGIFNYSWHKWIRCPECI